MRVCVGAAGRFHMVDLARQMERFGYLTKLYTGELRNRIHGLPASRVSSYPWGMLPARIAARFNWQSLHETLNVAAIRSFDKWMARNVEPCDVFHTLSSYATIAEQEVAKKYEALLVCERLSSHISYQDEILAEEHARWGQPYKPINRRIVERELQEYMQCDRIIVPSTFARRSFVERGITDAKIRIAPLGVDLRAFHPAPRQDDVFRVLYVGTLSLRKGIPYLLEAFRNLRLPNAELCFIGGSLPEMQPFLKKYEGVFRYLGALPSAELFQHYSQGSVLILPSIEDGFGMVMAQAMACGVPVIASRNTGAEDLFEDGREGYIVPIRDGPAIEDRILRLHDHPELRNEMSRLGLERVKHLGGWDSYGDLVAAVYREAIAAKSG